MDGVHYNFTTIPAMEAEIAAGRFLEHANVHGKIYGTSFAAVETVAAEVRRRWRLLNTSEVEHT